MKRSVMKNPFIRSPHRPNVILSVVKYPKLRKAVFSTMGFFERCSQNDGLERALEFFRLRVRMTVESKIYPFVKWFKRKQNKENEHLPTEVY